MLTYSVSEGSVVLTIDHKRVATRRLREGEDSRAVAKEMLRARSAQSAFDRPLEYPALGIV
jgi:hypothetical protein